MSTSVINYVLITPARDEEAHIEKTIQAVISQTILPLKWIIVSDSSVDETDEIIKSYLNNLSDLEQDKRKKKIITDLDKDLLKIEHKINPE